MDVLLENISHFFSLLNFTDFIDLFLVWAVVYRLMLFSKSEGAYQILSGLAVLGLAYWLSIWLELITFNWLLETFFSNIFIIAVILFQGEIRHALAQIGSNPFFISDSRRFQESHVVEELCKGLFQLGQRGIGALVVIEGNVELDYFVEKGVEIDAKVSADLISSLFLSKSPLHDGAVVIRKTRVYAASCFLPLSKNPIIDKGLGTRHRAALGLSEETDATVFVVSEESKTIGMAKEGRFVPDLDISLLRQNISQAFGLKTAVPGRKEESGV